MKQRIAEVLVGGAICVGLGGAALAVTFNDEAHPASKGKSYLEQKGYSHVQGGKTSSYWNGCGDSVMSRKYTVEAPDGKTANKIVCFGPFGPYTPILGS